MSPSVGASEWRGSQPSPKTSLSVVWRFIPDAPGSSSIRISNGARGFSGPELRLDRMAAEALDLGANAVLDMRFSTSYIMGMAAEILAYGNAVVLEEE